MKSGKTIRRGVSRGLKFCPTHRCRPHHVMIDASDFVRLLGNIGLATDVDESLAADVAAGFLRPNIEKYFGKELASNFTGTLDSDGVAVSLHFRKPLTAKALEAKIERIEKAAENKRRKAEGLPVEKPAPKVKPPKRDVPKVTLAVDVGRVNIVNMRVFIDGKPLMVERPPSVDGKPRPPQHLTFRLTAAEMWTASGVRRRAKISRRRRTKAKLNLLDRSLSATTLRSGSIDDVKKYMEAFNASRDPAWEWALNHATKQDSFRNRAGLDRVLDRFYSRVKREVRKHAPGVKADDIVVAWGDARVSPTGKGNLPAPTCRAYRRAVKRFKHVELSDEYRTSRTCPCCHSDLSAVRVVAHALDIVTTFPRGNVSRGIRHGFVHEGTNSCRMARRAAAGKATYVFDRHGHKHVSLCWKVDGHADESDLVKKEKRALRGATYVRYVRGLRFCQGCQKFMDRDHVGADNIATVWKFDRCSDDKRPDAFDRSAQKAKRQRKDKPLARPKRKPKS